MLHITNGDSVAHTLARAGLGGEIVTQADVLHEGPCPGGAPGEWVETRARYLARRGFVPYEEALERLVASDDALGRVPLQDEAVLWFEHDLFDQLILIRLLSWFQTNGTGRAALSLVSINSYPGFARFCGLGQLTASQLAGLFPGRRPITPAQLQLGDEAWRRFTSPDPEGFAALLGADTRPLPYLNAAVRRALEEYPSTLNGLSRSEHQALAAVAAGAPDLASAFRSTQDMEHDVFMGDLSFYAIMQDLADASLPLLMLERPMGPSPGAREAALTPLGREVLAGRADHAALNGIDRWMGGVHLEGATPAWRWDPSRGLMAAR